MQTLVIQTQHKENYGAHDWDGKGECPQYWKFKGGSTYFVMDLTDSQVAKIEATGIPTLESLIENRDQYGEEYILNWEIRDLGKDGGGKGPLCESWETPIEFTYYKDENIADTGWRCRTHHTYGDDEHVRTGIDSKAEQWKPTVNGGREDYECSFQTKNGWFDQNDPKLWSDLESWDDSKKEVA